MDWFRLHDEFLTDPKMLMYFTKAERCDWIGLLCLANRSRDRGIVTMPDAEIAYALDLKPAKWTALAAKFIERGMIEQGEDGSYIIAKWHPRQFSKPSDAPERVNERVKKYRDSKRNAPVTPDTETCNAPVTRVKRPVTPCNDTETEQRQNRTETETDIDTGDIPPPRESGQVGRPPFLSQKQKQKFIAETLEANPHWKETLDQRVASAEPDNADNYRAKVLRNWIDGDGTPPPPKPKRRTIKALIPMVDEQGRDAPDFPVYENQTVEEIKAWLISTRGPKCLRENCAVAA